VRTVLLVCNKIPHYRVSVYNYLSKRFNAEGWNFKVASFGLGKENQLRVHFDYRELPFEFRNYRRLVQEVNPDVVILHLHLRYFLFWSFLHWLKLRRIPVINWTKGGNLDRPNSRTRQAVFNYGHTLCDALVLYSAEQTPLISPWNRHKIFAANNAVNFEDYPVVEETREQIKAEFKIPFSKMVLFAGTMGVEGERKKVDHLLEVFANLDRSDIGLVLVGGGMSDERKARINPRNTMYLGEVHDAQNLKISKLFKAADVFVVPGHVGLAVNQAFYWGLPVVTEAGMQPPEIQYLKSGRNGFIVGENDIAALREKMLYLLDNPEIRAEFSRNAKEDIHVDAPIEGMFQGFYAAVRSVCPSTVPLPQGHAALVANQSAG
jgi:glycosyltransferase involved in cell wall biosynthesis